MSQQGLPFVLSLICIVSLGVTAQTGDLANTTLQTEDPTTTQTQDHKSVTPTGHSPSSQNPTLTTNVSEQSLTGEGDSELSEESSTSQKSLTSTTDSLPSTISSAQDVTSDSSSVVISHSSAASTTVDQGGTTVTLVTSESPKELIDNTADTTVVTPSEEITTGPSGTMAGTMSSSSLSMTVETSTVFNNETSASNVRVTETTAVTTDLTPTKTNMTPMNTSESTNDDTVTLTSDIPTTDGTTESTSNASLETYMTTESSEHTSDFVTLTVSNLTTTYFGNENQTTETTNVISTDIGNVSHSTEMMGEEQNMTTESFSKELTEMDTTSVEQTTSAMSTTTDADISVGLGHVTYEIHLSGDCNIFSSPSKKDLFLEKISSLFAEKLQIDANYINIQDIQCGSVFLNVTFENVSSAKIEAMLTDLISANTTINIDVDNYTLEYQLQDFQIISQPAEESIQTSTFEISTKFEESTTQTTLTKIEFMLKFTGECSVLVSEGADDNNQQEFEIGTLSTESSTDYTTEHTTGQGETSQESHTFTTDITDEHSTDRTSQLVKGIASVMAEIPTTKIVSDTSDTTARTTLTSDTNQQTTESSNESSTNQQTKESSTESSTNQQTKESSTESSSISPDLEGTSTEISTAAQPVDDTPEQTSSTYSTDIIKTTTDLQQTTSFSQYANLSLKEQFKTILSIKLVNFLNISKESVVLGPVLCGSVLINVTIINIMNKEETETKMLGLPDQSETFTIIVQDEMGQEYTYQLSEVLNSQETLPEHTTQKLHDDEDDGLTEVELIIIIVCGVLGGALLLTLLVFVIYRCCSIRNRKSFALGDTPAQMDLEDFTLTKMTRPSPVYTDHGVMYINRPKQAPAYNNPLYQSNNGHYENHNTSSTAGGSGPTPARLSMENLVPESGGTQAEGGVENPSFASDDLLDSGSNTSTELPYDGKVDMNVIGENSKLM